MVKKKIQKKRNPVKKKAKTPAVKSAKHILAKKAAALKKKAQKKILSIVRKKTRRTTGVRSLKTSHQTGRKSAFQELLGNLKSSETTHEERKIEESKFDIGITHNAHAVPLYDIPFEYRVDRAVILTVDPSFVFAYWEVKTESMHDAVNHLGPNAKLTLRFYDISSGSDPANSPSWDVEVFDRLGNWYLRLEYPEQKLCLDIGMKNEFGVFRSIARSNVVRLPRQSLAATGPLKWMVVGPDGQKIITDVEEYTDADLELLKKILGPHFFDLLMRGKFSSIAGSSLEAVFQEVSSLRLPINVSSSPSSWSGKQT